MTRRRRDQRHKAEDGEAAMHVLAPNVGASFTLVICDLCMPRCSGVEFYRWLLRARPDVIDRLVFSTGDTERLEAVGFLGEVRRPVLAKPFELVDLARIVDAASTSAQAAWAGTLGSNGLRPRVASTG